MKTTTGNKSAGPYQEGKIIPYYCANTYYTVHYISTSDKVDAPPKKNVKELKIDVWMEGERK